jgi:hypothetical protein
MTFKPFPFRGREEEPSPIFLGTVPGEQAVKLKPRAPNPIICGDHDLKYGKTLSPGPKYMIKDWPCCKGITLVGRYPIKTETTPGPIYDVKNDSIGQPPKAVFQCRWKDRTKPPPPPCNWPLTEEQAENPLDPCTLLMQDPKGFKGRVLGGLMYPRWPEKEEEDPGPGFYNVFGFTNRGNYSKIPISLKSRHSPFVYTAMSKTAEIPDRTSCDVLKKRPPKTPNLPEDFEKKLYYTCL